MPSRVRASSMRVNVSLRRVQRHADAVATMFRSWRSRSPHALGDLAGVDEERHVHERTGGPAILAGEEQAVAVAEAPRRIAAQRVAAAELRHQEVRHVVAGGRIGRGGGRAKRDHPVLAQERDELLHLGVDAAEAVRPAVRLASSPTSRPGRGRRGACSPATCASRPRRTRGSVDRSDSRARRSRRRSGRSPPPNATKRAACTRADAPAVAVR